MNRETVKDIINKFNDNTFYGILKISNLYYLRLLKILCKTEDMVQKYLSEYYNPKFEYQYEVINSIQHFKRDILSKRTDTSEYQDKIRDYINTESWEHLWVVLQDLFLEPLAWSQVLDIVEMIHNGINEDDIMKWYCKGKKVLAMTTFNANYIKTA